MLLVWEPHVENPRTRVMLLKFSIRLSPTTEKSKLYAGVCSLSPDGKGCGNRRSSKAGNIQHWAHDFFFLKFPVLISKFRCILCYLWDVTKIPGVRESTHENQLMLEPIATVSFKSHDWDDPGRKSKSPFLPPTFSSSSKPYWQKVRVIHSAGKGEGTWQSPSPSRTEQNIEV